LRGPPFGKRVVQHVRLEEEGATKDENRNCCLLTAKTPYNWMDATEEKDSNRVSGGLNKQEGEENARRAAGSGKTPTSGGDTGSKIIDKTRRP